MAAPKGNQYAKGHGKGRPLTYDDDFIENEAAALLEWIKPEHDNDKKIYIGSFCIERGYDRYKMHEFSTKHEIFRHAYHQAKLWQENKFVTNALSRKWDAGFTQYIMARVCNPEWKKSWDMPTEAEDKPTTVIINKIEKQ